MNKSGIADISTFESLQNQAHESMGLSGLAVFNSTPDQLRGLRNVVGNLPRIEAKFKSIEEDKKRLDRERFSMIQEMLSMLGTLDAMRIKANREGDRDFAKAIEAEQRKANTVFTKAHRQ